MTDWPWADMREEVKRLRGVIGNAVVEFSRIEDETTGNARAMATAAKNAAIDALKTCLSGSTTK